MYPPYRPNFHPMFAYWIVTLNQLPGGGLEDPSCGYWHGTMPANEMSVHTPEVPDPPGCPADDGS